MQVPVSANCRGAASRTPPLPTISIRRGYRLLGWRFKDNKLMCVVCAASGPVPPAASQHLACDPSLCKPAPSPTNPQTPRPAGAPSEPLPDQHQPSQLKPSSRALLARRRATQKARSSTAGVDGGQPQLQQQQSISGAGSQADDTDAKFFRFWHDEKRFKGTGADSLVQRALAAAGGQRTGGHLKHDPAHGPLGWQRMASWDLLWSPASTALQAASQGLRRNQLVCAVPGSQSLTRKRRLPDTLGKAYGPAAGDIIPLTFQLPAQLGEWRAWMAAHPCPPGQQQQQQRLWMLKTAQHLGKGLQLVTQDEALDAVLRRQAQVVAYGMNRQRLRQDEPVAGPAAGGGGGGTSRIDPNQPRPFVVAQLYVADPLLLGTGAGGGGGGGGGGVAGGSKFGIRLWVVVVGSDPLRAYMHKNGLVLFASEQYDTCAGPQAEMAAAAAALSSGGEEEGTEEEGTEGQAAAATRPVPLAPRTPRAPQQGGARGAAGAGGAGGPQLAGVSSPPPATPLWNEEERRLAAARAVAASSSPTPGGATSSSASQPAAAAAAAAGSPPPPPPGHVTNYAQNVDGEVWSLRQLGEQLGAERFSLLYRRLLRSAALSVAAALPSVRSEAARVQLPATPQGGGCFELFGLDYLVDSSMRPWLLEVNATPSLAVQHSDPRVEQLIRQQKEGMVADMVALLGLRGRYPAGRGASRAGEAGEPVGSGGGGGSGEEGGGGGGSGSDMERLQEVLQATYPQVFYEPRLLDVMEATETELRLRGSFLPLMPLFPPPGPQPAAWGATRGRAGGDKSAKSSTTSSAAAMATAAAVGAARCSREGGAGAGPGFGSGAEAATGAGGPAGRADASEYLLDASPLPAACGANLPWSEADLMVRAWCRDRERPGARRGGKAAAAGNGAARGAPAAGAPTRAVLPAAKKASSGGR